MGDLIISTASVQREFFTSYEVLSPQRDAISELAASGVKTSAILSLYPFKVQEITPYLMLLLKMDRDAIMGFCEETLNRRFKLQAPKVMSNVHMAAFRLDGYDELVRTKGSQWWTSGWASDAKSRRAARAQGAVAESLWVGAHWNELPELWESEEWYRDDLRFTRESLLAAILDAKTSKGVELEHDRSI